MLTSEQLEIATILMEAILAAREERARLFAIMESRLLRDGEQANYNQMCGKLAHIENDLIDAKDEAEMLVIVKKAVYKP